MPERARAAVRDGGTNEERERLFQQRREKGRPHGVAGGGQMEFVGEVKFGAGQAVGAEHGPPDVEEGEAYRVGGAVGGDEGVGFEAFFANIPA